MKCFAPAIAVNEVVPLGDEVVDRAAAGHPADQKTGVTVWRSAIHAARALLTDFVVVAMFVDFFPVFDTFERVAVRDGGAFDFEESGWFTHVLSF